MRRPVVAAPLFTPASYTLSDYIQWVDSNDPHWKLGVDIEPYCGIVDTTFDYCIITGAATDFSSPAKTNNATKNTRAATPFTVFGEIDCSPPGFWDNAEANVSTQLARTESWQVERVFWTGTVAGITDIKYPHLASNTEVVAPYGAVLQTAASVPVTGTVDVVEGLAALESYLGDCYNGVGIIHTTLAAFYELVRYEVIYRDGGRWRTMKGNFVVPGNGYAGQAPDGTSPTYGESWMYVTGAIFGYRSRPKRVGSPKESFDRDINTLKMIVERTYVIGWDCCHAAVHVAHGGVVTGTANSAA